MTKDNTDLRTIIKDIGTGNQLIFRLEDLGLQGNNSRVTIRKIVFTCTSANAATLNLHTNTTSIPIKTAASSGGEVILTEEDLYLSNSSADNSRAGGGVTHITIDSDTATNGRVYIALDIMGS